MAIKIVAHNFIKPECLDDAIEAFKPLVQGSRKEEGNISYDLFADIEDPYHLVIVEEWESMDFLPAHRETEHFTGSIAKLGPMMSKQGSVTRMNPVVI